MYREIPRTNRRSEASFYGLDRAQRAVDDRGDSSVLQETSPVVIADQPEALVAAISLAALLLIILVSALQAWL